MNLNKTLKLKIGKLTKKKQLLLLKEYTEFQKAVKFSADFITQNKIYTRYELTKQLYSSGKIKDVAKLYSATYQCAYTETLKIKNKDKNAKITHVPLTLRNDTFELIKTTNKHFPYFIKIPIAGIRGGIYLPLHVQDFQQLEIKQCTIRDSRISYKNGNFFLHLVIEKEVENKIKLEKEKLALISIDLGERNPAVSVIRLGDSMKPHFYRDNIRAVRAHYRILRQRLGKKKLLKKIKQMKDKESRITRDINHKISTSIVQEAKQLKAGGYQPIITMGNLIHIRNASKKKGRAMRRRISQWSYYQLQQFIRYKALWDGIPVGFVSEYKTSKTCHRCKREGIRKAGLFKCLGCSMEYNADINGAINIGTRSLEYIFGDRASMTVPLSWAEKNDGSLNHARTT